MDVGECICYLLPPEMHTTHYGATEPGSMYEPNPECREHFRKPPYRLADGTWSDGVDRKHEIAAYRFGIANPSRMSVNFDEAEGVFAVWKGTQPIKEFLTHAEAIAYADRMARTN